MPDLTVAIERIIAPIPPGVRKDNEYAADGSGRDYTYDYFDIEEARRAVTVDKLRGDESDRVRQLAQPLARSADWGKVVALGVAALTHESKDLTIAAWVVEALGHLRGFAGLRDGLRLFRRLQDRYRGSSFPRDPDDPTVQLGPYEFLSGERNLPYLIRGLPLAEPEPGFGYSLFHRREADRNEKRRHEPLRPDERSEDRDGLFLPEDWAAAVAQTEPATWERLADELAACLIAFRAWERSTDRLWQGQRSSPSLTAIGEALVDCAEEVSRLQPNPAHPSALALALALRRLASGRPPAPPSSTPAAPPLATPEPSRVEPPPPPRAVAAPRLAERDPIPPPEPSPAALLGQPITDAESAYAQVVAAAEFLRASDPRDPVPYLLVRSLRLGELGRKRADPDSGDDLPPAPPSATRRELRRLANGGDWALASERIETVLARPEGQGWFDAHRLAVQALEELGHAEAAAACRALLVAVLHQHPERAGGELDDGTAASSAETQGWLADLLGAAATPASRPESAPAESSAVAADTDASPLTAPITDHAREALALLQASRDAEAVARLQLALDAQTGDRARFALIVRFAEACRAEGADRLASSLLEGMFAELEASGATLRTWEGRPFFAPAATLLRDALTQIDDPLAADRLARAQARVLALAPGAGLRRAGD